MCALGSFIDAAGKSSLLPALNAKAEFNNLRNQAREVRCDLALTEMKEKGGGSIGTVYEGWIAGGNRWSTRFFRHQSLGNLKKKKEVEG